MDECISTSAHFIPFISLCRASQTSLSQTHSGCSALWHKVERFAALTQTTGLTHAINSICVKFPMCVIKECKENADCMPIDGVCDHSIDDGIACSIWFFLFAVVSHLMSQNANDRVQIYIPSDGTKGSLGF